MHVEHDTRHVTGKLRRSYLCEKSIISDNETLSSKLRRKMRMVQVKEDAVRVFYARCLILHLIAEIDRHSRVCRGGPMPNACDLGDRSV